MRSYATQEEQQGQVASVSSSPRHTFSKQVQSNIRLLAGMGVESDAHAGATVRHRYRVKQDPTQPNLCQAHLLEEELFQQLSIEGFSVCAGDLGENITTNGVDLINLPVNTQLELGESAVVQLTGLRTPCVQLDRFRPGLMSYMKGVAIDGAATPRCGVMAIVIRSGVVQSGDRVRIVLPPTPYRELQCV